MSESPPEPPSRDSGDAGAAGEESPPPSFFRRRVVGPIKTLLTQGVTPDHLSWTLGACAACSMFPFLGTTSMLNLAVGLRFRMNQPLMQTLNQLLGPIHIVMILVYVRVGEWLVGAGSSERFDVMEMVRAFDELSFGDFLERFGRAGLHALVAWAVTAPLLVIGVRAATRPLLFKLARRRA